jgi:hypothetical protein
MDIIRDSGTEGAKHYIGLLRNQPSAGLYIHLAVDYQTDAGESYGASQ